MAIPIADLNTVTSIKIPMSYQVKCELISLFEESYYNTDLDATTYALEFIEVVETILESRLPIDAKYLDIKEIYICIETILNKKPND